jgi:hypothetical protein
MSTGLDMMMKSMLGISPAELQGQMTGFLQHVNAVITQMNDRQARMEAALARIEGMLDHQHNEREIVLLANDVSEAIKQEFEHV